jgi:hypothetical protein
LETVQSFILTQIDREFAECDEPMTVRRFAAHFSVQTDKTESFEWRMPHRLNHPARQTIYYEWGTEHDRIYAYKQIAQALGLPVKLIDDLLSAVFCHLCRRISRYEEGSYVRYSHELPPCHERSKRVSFVLEDYACKACKEKFFGSTKLYQQYW